MVDPQIVSLADTIRKNLPGSESLDQAAKRTRQVLEPLLGRFSPELEQHFTKAVELVRSEIENRVEILHRHSLLRARESSWYQGPRATDVQWPALKDYLKNAKHWDDQAVDAVDAASTEIVSLLEDPTKESFASRGLVVGYVQSGKTANMTAVIAKAVDAGYNFIVILAGLTNALRGQTQRRLENDIVDRHRHNWNLLTTNEDDGDFRMPANRQFLMPRKGYADIAILKKNKSPLQHFIRTLSRTPRQAMSRLRVLIIDDECDQASVNSSNDEVKLTVINEKIRNILSMLPCVSYVGYTATPFANVLINPYPPNAHTLDDLYPKDFITALPKPMGYFGTEDLFGRSPKDAGEEGVDEEGFDMIRRIPSEDERRLQPPSQKAKNSFHPEMPNSLKEAVLYFLACCAARRARGQKGQHMSMLIHTSAYVVMHERVAELVSRWISDVRPELEQNRGDAWERLSSVWTTEGHRLPGTITRERRIALDELRPYLREVLSELEIPVENGFSDDRLDYVTRTRTYIVVGGSVLARGLTIEGLMVSYFLRSSSQYDTLLQMGRWFGYRPGYEDLPRIWMTDDLALAFRALATVEAEIRSDIEEYRQRNVTPMEFAVRIRAIPGMAVTAANKMRAARVCDVSYSGKHIQTIRFAHRDARVINANWAAGSSLLSELNGLGLARVNGTRTYFANVPLANVLGFLRKYSVHPSHKELSDQFLLGYVTGRSDQLGRWSVALWEPEKSGAPTAQLDGFGEIRLNNRARLKGSTEDVADIKALMSRKDVLIDCPNIVTDADDWSGLKRAREAVVGSIPLLLLYGIDANSRPQSGNAREGLQAVSHLLGFGIVFPGSLDTSGRFYSVELDPLSADEIEEEDIGT
jgi:hypothetical protein